ncbi:MAG: AAA family ATPase, partial [Beijerinckiaceae bacterium]
GSGKSTAAAEIAPQTGPPPGARILSTDRIRKSLFGKQAQERLPQEAYEAEVSQRVYEMQRRETFAALQGGWSAIADGVFLREDERAAIAAVAGKAGATFNGIWLDAPEDRLIARVEARRNDPSDATAGVVQQQLRWQTQVRDWTHIDASRPAGATARAILDAAVAAPPKRERRL